MKFYNLIMISLLSLVISSCTSQMIRLADGNYVDKRLVGTWVGSESDQQISGVQKSWEMKRNSDGSFILNFTYSQDGEIHNSVETGKWWIENGRFNEFHNDSGKTDVYKYEILSQDKVKFTSETISVDMNKKKYEFIDTRIP